MCPWGQCHVHLQSLPRTWHRSGCRTDLSNQHDSEEQEWHKSNTHPQSGKSVPTVQKSSIKKALRKQLHGLVPSPNCPLELMPRHLPERGRAHAWLREVEYAQTAELLEHFNGIWSTGRAFAIIKRLQNPLARKRTEHNLDGPGVENE